MSFLLKEKLKRLLREVLLYLKWDLSANIRNDRLTIAALQKLLKQNSNCIDIGAHKGEITKLILQFAPEGKHYAFEPIPEYYNLLNSIYGDQVIVRSDALSNEDGTDDFHVLRNDKAYSGLQKRTYLSANPQVSIIKVQKARLDDVLLESFQPDFIKIDVEGGEFQVLQGAKEILQKHHPAIIMEFGLGAADHYGVTPEMMYDLLVGELGYTIYGLAAYVDDKRAHTLESFSNCYETNEEYYFVAIS